MTVERQHYFLSNKYRRTLKVGDELVTLSKHGDFPPIHGVVINITDDLVIRVDWRDPSLLNLSIGSKESFVSRQLSLRLCDLSPDEASELVTNRLNNV